MSSKHLSDFPAGWCSMVIEAIAGEAENEVCCDYKAFVSGGRGLKL